MLSLMSSDRTELDGTLGAQSPQNANNIIVSNEIITCSLKIIHRPFDEQLLWNNLNWG